MSVTRRTWTDDSGNLSSGTIVNNAELQRVYDDIDSRWSVVTITSVGTQNNLAVSEADFVIFNNATDLTVTGIGAPSSPAKPGKPLRYVCVGAGNVFFADSASATASTSTAANRIVCFAKSGLTPHSGGSGAGVMVYDATVALPRWRLVAHEQGAWITWTPTWTGSGALTFTGVTNTTTKYRLSGRTLQLVIAATGTFGGTTDTTLSASLPSTFIAAVLASTTQRFRDGAGAWSAGAIFVSASGAVVNVVKIDSSNIALGASGVAQATIACEVT